MDLSQDPAALTEIVRKEAELDMKSENYDSWALPVLAAWPKVRQIVTGQIPVPEVVEIFPTNFCNFNCPHCRCKPYHRDDTASMDIDILRRLFDELKFHGVRNLELSGGGEPLVHPKITDLFDCIIQNGFRVGLITNGYPLVESDSLKEKVAECCSWIRFSVDAFTDAGYQRVHGKKDIRYRELKQTIAGLVRSAGGQFKIGIKTLVSKLNASDAMLAIPQALETGVNYVQIKFLGFPTEWALSEEDATALSERIQMQVESLGDTSVQVELLPPYRGDPGSGKCLMTFLHAVIDWDGEVYICAFFEHRKTQHSIGNIRNRGFMEVWEGAKHKQTFQTIDPRTCVPNCPMRRYNPLVTFIQEQDFREGFI